MLGLADMEVALILTPDMHKGRPVKTEKAFWAPLLERFPPDKFGLTLLDDSATNCQFAEEMGFDVIRVGEGMPFASALASFLGLLRGDYLTLAREVTICFSRALTLTPCA